MNRAFTRKTLAALLCCLIASIGIGQSRSRRDEKPSEKALSVRLQKAEEALVSEYKDVASEFYKQGNKEKAMKMLRRLKELSPKLEGLSENIDSINEELMQANENEIEIDTRKPWEFVGNVAEGQAYRVAAQGECKLSLSLTVGVEGLVTEKDSKDYVSGQPLGCLLGVIVTDGKPGKPFPIKAELQQTPKKSGKLFVKVNVPEGTRCSGKLKVQVSGYIQTGRN